MLFKKLLISSILATDMAKHPKLLEKFSKRANLTIKVKNDPKYLEEHKSLLEEFIFSEKRIDDRRVFLKKIKLN